MAGLGPAIHHDPRQRVDARPKAGHTHLFPRRLRLDRERVQAALEGAGERRVDDAVALDPALPFEGPRHHINAEMGLAALAPAGMAEVLLGFVLHHETDGIEPLAKRRGYPVLETHWRKLTFSAALTRALRDSALSRPWPAAPTPS